MENLRLERCNYMSRVQALAAQGGEDAETEIRGYLRSIENINMAMIRLARMSDAGQAWTPANSAATGDELPIAA